MIRNVLLGSLAVGMFSLGTLTLNAEEPAAFDPTKTAAPKVCTAYLKGEYVAAIKPAEFLDGGKLTGSFLGFDNDFAKFKVKNFKEEIFIPKSAILYMLVPSAAVGIQF